ncbi:MAG: hypothetical protein DME04_08885 [Candidatus Rokuibacteriota bacterium]|nr:MAG: hypothetical protein DME04_08885 [Candidatus Rokubacteria bacterium]
MTHDPHFGTSLRRDPSQPGDLSARIDAQLRERLEEAVDFVCLDALVQRRRALSLPPPSADNPRDREEFTRGVRTFLERTKAGLLPDLGAESRAKVAAAEGAPGDEDARLIGVHVVLARELPDYWQRFEAARTAYTAEQVASGGERRGVLGRLFGRG